MDEGNLKIHFRHVLLFLFNENNKISHREVVKRICKVYGNRAISEFTVRKWFNRFKDGDFNLDDKPRTGRPSDFDETQLKLVVESDPKLTVRILASRFNCSFGTMQSHLHSLGFVSKLGNWVPHKLTQANKNKRKDIATDLLSRYNRGELPLDSILTCDEKWCLYANIIRQRHWVPQGTTPPPTARAGLHPRKVMLCLFWDTEGPLHFEFVPDGSTINAQSYCDQLDRVHAKLQQNRSHRQNVFFLHDNARPHTARVTTAKIQQLGWHLLPHPPYSPDLAPTDFKAFRSLQNFLNNHEYRTEDEVKAAIETWIASKSPGFWVKGIIDLPRRWNKVVEFDGDYFDD